MNQSAGGFPARLPFSGLIISIMEPGGKYARGSVSYIEPKTFGEPGQRTFNLILDAGEAVWMQKEQLFQLGIYLQEVVDKSHAQVLNLGHGRGNRTGLEYRLARARTYLKKTGSSYSVGRAISRSQRGSSSCSVIQNPARHTII